MRSFLTLFVFCIGSSMSWGQTQPAYNPAGAVNPQTQQQLTPEQQQAILRYQQHQQQLAEQQRQLQLQQQQQLQRDPRFVQPAQYQPPANPGIAPTAPGQPLQPPAQPGQLQPVTGQPATLQPPGQPQPGNPQPGQPVQLQPARAPFQLTPQQEAELNQVLVSWERVNSAVKTYSAVFKRWSYNPAILNSQKFSPDTATEIADGEINYQAPDRGIFKITGVSILNQETGKHDAAREYSRYDHWVCDGLYMYQVKHQDKQLEKIELPENMRGLQIADGPLPFVFGQKAEKLKARFWMKISTPAGNTNQIWIEAYPKTQADAANYKRVDLILDAKNMYPLAIQTHVPDPKSAQREVYQFDKHSVNGFFAGKIGPPDVPRDYKLIEQKQPVTTPGTMPGPGPTSTVKNPPSPNMVPPR